MEIRAVGPHGQIYLFHLNDGPNGEYELLSRDGTTSRRYPMTSKHTVAWLLQKCQFIEFVDSVTFASQQNILDIIQRFENKLGLDASFSESFYSALGEKNLKKMADSLYTSLSKALEANGEQLDLETWKGLLGEILDYGMQGRMESFYDQNQDLESIQDLTLYKKMLEEGETTENYYNDRMVDALFDLSVNNPMNYKLTVTGLHKENIIWNTLNFESIEFNRQHEIIMDNLQTFEDSEFLAELQQQIDDPTTPFPQISVRTFQDNKMLMWLGEAAVDPEQPCQSIIEVEFLPTFIMPKEKSNNLGRFAYYLQKILPTTIIDSDLAAGSTITSFRSKGLDPWYRARESRGGGPETSLTVGSQAFVMYLKPLLGFMPEGISVNGVPVPNIGAELFVNQYHEQNLRTYIERKTGVAPTNEQWSQFKSSMKDWIMEELWVDGNFKFNIVGYKADNFRDAHSVAFRSKLNSIFGIDTQSVRITAGIRAVNPDLPGKAFYEKFDGDFQNIRQAYLDYADYSQNFLSSGNRYHVSEIEMRINSLQVASASSQWSESNINNVGRRFTTVLGIGSDHSIYGSIVEYGILEGWIMQAESFMAKLGYSSNTLSILQQMIIAELQHNHHRSYRRYNPRFPIGQYSYPIYDPPTISFYRDGTKIIKPIGENALTDQDLQIILGGDIATAENILSYLPNGNYKWDSQEHGMFPQQFASRGTSAYVRVIDPSGDIVYVRESSNQGLEHGIATGWLDDIPLRPNSKGVPATAHLKNYILGSIAQGLGYLPGVAQTTYYTKFDIQILIDSWNANHHSSISMETYIKSILQTTMKDINPDGGLIGNQDELGIFEYHKSASRNLGYIFSKIQGYINKLKKGFCVTDVVPDAKTREMWIQAHKYSNFDLQLLNPVTEHWDKKRGNTAYFDTLKVMGHQNPIWTESETRFFQVVKMRCNLLSVEIDGVSTPISSLSDEEFICHLDTIVDTHYNVIKAELRFLSTKYSGEFKDLHRDLQKHDSVYMAEPNRRDENRFPTDKYFWVHAAQHVMKWSGIDPATHQPGEITMSGLTEYTCVDTDRGGQIIAPVKIGNVEQTCSHAFNFNLPPSGSFTGGYYHHLREGTIWDIINQYPELSISKWLIRFRDTPRFTPD
jgi:hypothetical protein